MCPLFLSCALSGGEPDIVLTKHSGRPTLVHLSSVLPHSLLFPYRHLSHEHLGCKTRTCKVYIVVGLAALAQMVACLPLVQQVRGSIP